LPETRWRSSPRGACGFVDSPDRTTASLVLSSGALLSARQNRATVCLSCPACSGNHKWGVVLAPGSKKRPADEWRRDRRNMGAASSPASAPSGRDPLSAEAPNGTTPGEAFRNLAPDFLARRPFFVVNPGANRSH
jgi:hypothetical protein